MDYRYAAASDRAALTALWQEAFCDSPAEIHFLFDTLGSTMQTFVAVQDGALIAMAHTVGQTLCLGDSVFPIAYLYAVATRAAFRGRGICRALLSFGEACLRQAGFTACVLVPAKPSLFPFYKKLSFETAFYAEMTEYAPTSRRLPAATCTAETYRALRAQYLEGICHNVPPLAVLRLTGGLFHFADGCFCASRQPDGTVFVPELLGDLADGLAALSVAVPGTSYRIRRQGHTPFAMVKQLTVFPCIPENGWFSFALE